jgi:hypothetical protein
MYWIATLTMYHLKKNCNVIIVWENWEVFGEMCYSQCKFVLFMAKFGVNSQNFQHNYFKKNLGLVVMRMFLFICVF